MSYARRWALEALKAQGIERPGPKLLELTTDAMARVEEPGPPGERTHDFDYAEIFADTPELFDRTRGPHSARRSRLAVA